MNAGSRTTWAARLLLFAIGPAFTTTPPAPQQPAARTSDSLGRVSKTLFKIPLLAAFGALAACAANGDPPPGSTVPAGDPPGHAAATEPAAGLAAPLESRDIAILVLEQTPAFLRVTSNARRPRSAFGPAAGWNGSGTPTHTWVLRGPHGEALASGDIVARSTLEAPPNPAQGATAAHVPQDSFSFTVKVPQPAPGEVIEIAPAGASGLVARWP